MSDEEFNAEFPQEFIDEIIKEALDENRICECVYPVLIENGLL